GDVAGPEPVEGDERVAGGHAGAADRDRVAGLADVGDVVVPALRHAQQALVVAAREAHAEVTDTGAVAGEGVDDDVGHALRLLGGDGRVARVAADAGGVGLL